MTDNTATSTYDRTPPPAARRRIHLRTARLHTRQRPARNAATRPGAGAGRHRPGAADPGTGSHARSSAVLNNARLSATTPLGRRW